MPRYKIIDFTWLHLKAGPQLLQPYTTVTHPDGKTEQVETIIEFDGWPNAAMEAMDDEAKELVEVVSRLRSAGQLPKSPAAWRGESRKSREATSV